MAKKLTPANSPWESCLWEPADASSIQALFRGDADDIQQKRAINWIVNNACALPYLAYDKANSRNTDFALGKQWVGHEIIRLMRIDVSKLLEGTKRD